MLKYVGEGKFITGVPMRDLSDDEVKALGGEATLIKTGLYARESSKPASKHKEQDAEIERA